MVFDPSFATSILPLLVDAAITTVRISVLSFLGACTFGVLISALRRVSNRNGKRGIALVTDFIRMTPVLIQVFFLYFWLPEIGIALSPFETGVLALSLHYGCYLAEVFRAGLEGVDRGQWDALRSLSVPSYAAYRYVILPAAIRPILPAAGNHLILMFKETPVLASISVTEMLFVSSQIGAEQFRYTEPVTICGCLFLIMSVSSGWVVRRLEAALATNLAKSNSPNAVGDLSGPQAV